MDSDEVRRVRFRELFDGNFRALLVYATRRVVRPVDAADVVAETLLVAWRRIDEVPPGDEARLWLYGVARYVVKNQYRGSRRRSNLGERLRQELVAISVDDPSEGSALNAVVQAAMDRLDPGERELIRLTSWEGLAPSEIAKVYSTPQGTVRRRLHHARQSMRRELDALGWPEDVASADDDDLSPSVPNAGEDDL